MTNHITDEQIDAALREIDSIARDVASTELGLPLDADDDQGQPHAKMRDAIRAVLALAARQSEPAQPRTIDARNAQFREEIWQVRFDSVVEARRAAQEQLYTERERHTAEVKRLQAEIGRLQAETAEPFGYFRATPDGWEDCGEHDEGAVALYTAPAPQGEPVAPGPGIDDLLRCRALVQGTAPAVPSDELPEIGSLWQHTNGNVYKVLSIANEFTQDSARYPKIVVYQGAANGLVWARAASEWHRSMALAAAPTTSQSESPCACWPGRMCSRSAQCARDFQPAVPKSADTPPAQSANIGTDQRALFERWATNDGAWPDNVARSAESPEEYANSYIQDAWLAVQATSHTPAQPAVPEDVARLDALGTPGWELSMNDDPECGTDELWQVHRVSGGRNDREWTLIGSGANPRAAIDAARKAEKGGE